MFLIKNVYIVLTHRENKLTNINKKPPFYISCRYQVLNFTLTSELLRAFPLINTGPSLSHKVIKN